MKICLRNKTAILLGFALTLILFGSIVKNASAQEAVLLCDGPAIVNVNTQTEFEVSIIAANVSDLYGWEFILTWDHTVVNCTLEELNFGIWGTGNYLGPWVSPSIDNVAGEYHQSVTGKAPGVPFDGTAWLANLTFTVVATSFPAATDFTLDKAPGYTAYCLLDISATEIPHLYQNGHVDIIIPEFLSLLILPLLMLASASALLIRKLRKHK